MAKAIYFDMDGTVADLYGVDNWLDMLRAEDVTPYQVAQPLVDMVALNALLLELAGHGWTVGVITWTAMGGSAEYNRATRKAKLDWVREYMPAVTEFHAVKYGTPKHSVAKVKGGVLVDDNADVRGAWRGIALTEKNLLETLEKLLTLFGQRGIM